MIFTSLISSSAYANKCQEYGLGWHFYCQKEQQDEKQTKESPEDQSDYKEKMANIRKTLEDKKEKAIVYPTEENIKEYMGYQQLVLDKSGFFADQWRRVLWKTPSLDYTLKRPVSKVGKESWIDNRNLAVTNTIKNINNRYGIFFLFSSTCPHCHRYSPILKNFQEKYGITIMPISMDGEGLKEWDNFMVNNGQIKKMGINVEAVPATILFDKETRQVIPIGFGVLSHSELEERIYATTKLEVGNDF
jgi:conjugal transfer pilus assembly protein TraF